MSGLKIYYKKDLDGMECSNPGCDHTSHAGDEMFVHQACHTGAGLNLRNLGDLIELSCAQCSKGVIYIATGYPYFDDRSCGHKGTPSYVSYKDGTVNIHCVECDQVYLHILVQEGRV